VAAVIGTPIALYLPVRIKQESAAAKETRATLSRAP
jgi:hypothetical protein